MANHRRTLRLAAGFLSNRTFQPLRRAQLCLKAGRHPPPVCWLDQLATPGRLSAKRFAVTAVGVKNEPADHADANYNEQELAGTTQIDRTYLESILSQIDSSVKRQGRVPLAKFQDLMRIALGAENTAGHVMPTSTHALLMLRCCGKLLPEMPATHRAEALNRLWEHFQRTGVRLDVSHYNAYLKALLDNEATFSPADLLASMERNKIEPNRVTYQRVIAYYCQHGNIEAATKILEHMKSQSMAINEYVFRSLIQGHARAKDMQNAERILDVMRKSDIEPDAEVYSTLLEGYATNGDIDKVREVIGLAAENYGVNFSHRELLNVIKAFALSGHPQYVQDVIGVMNKVTGYGQDCLNMALELVNAGASETAYKLILTLPLPDDVQKSSFGILFLKQLIQNTNEQSNNVELLLRYCEDLRSSQSNPYSYQRACEWALRVGKKPIVIALLRKMHELHMPIRQHYFWPLLVQTNAEGTKVNEMWEVVDLMRELEVLPSLETAADYIVPALESTNVGVESMMEDLKGRFGLRSALNFLVRHHLQNGNLALVADLIQQFESVEINLERVSRLVTTQMGKQRDAANGAKLLALLMQGLDPSIQDFRQRELLEAYFVQAVVSADGDEQFAIGLGQEMTKRRIPVSHNVLDALENRYGQRWAPETYKKLAELCSRSSRGTVYETEFSGGRSRDSGRARRTDDYDMNDNARRSEDVDTLQAHVAELESRNLSPRGVLRRLFMEYSRMSDVEKLEETKRKLDSLGFVYTAGMLASLLETYVRSDRLADAVETYRILRETHPGFKIEGYKTLQLATLFVKGGQVDEATDLLARAYGDNGDQPLDVEAFDRVIFRFLNLAAERGDSEALDKMWEALCRYTNAQMTSLIAGVFIKVHVRRDDWKAALEAFENCATKFKFTPWKNELTKHFIENEDPANLQRVLDCSIGLFGELNSLYDLAFCFLELGHKKQAEKIFDTPGMRARKDRLDHFCDRLARSDSMDSLEALVEVTRNLYDIDRDAMYYQLIRGYRRRGQVDKALSTWTDMEEEGVQPSATTLRFLANFLAESGREVPFDVPEEANVAETSSVDGSLEDCIRTGNANRAVHLYRQNVGMGLSIRVRSNLIEMLIKCDRVGDAVQITQDMLASGQHPFPAVIKYLLTTLNNKGDVETVCSLANKFPPNIAGFINLDRHLADSYINAGRGDEILDQYEKNAAFMSDGGAENARGPQVLSGPLFRLLKRENKLENRIRSLADKLAQRGVYQASEALWEYLFVNHRFDEANDLAKKYPQMVRSQRVMRICEHAKNANDSVLVRSLAEDQMQKGNHDSACIAWSYLLSQFVHNGEYDAAVNLVDELRTRGTRLEDLRSGPLRALHAALQNSGKTPSFEVPQTQTFSSYRSRRGGIRQSASNDKSGNIADEGAEEEDEAQRAAA